MLKSVMERVKQVTSGAAGGRWLLLAGLSMALLLIVFLASTQTAQPSGVPPGEWFAAESHFVNDHVLVKVALPNAAPSWWILDTGSTHNLLDDALAQRVGAKTRGRIRDVNRPDYYFRSVDAPSGRIVGADGGLGPLLDLQGSGALDLGELASAIARTPYRREHLDGTAKRVDHSQVQGVIGFPFLRKWVVSIDFPRKRVWMRVPTDATLAPPGPSHSAPLPLRARIGKHKLLILELDVNGVRGPWSLDTGSNISVMSPEHPQRDAGEPDGEARNAQLVNREVRVQPRLYSVSFVGQRRESATQSARIHVPRESFAKAIEGLDGNLGTNLLRPYRLTLDYDHGQVVLD